MFDPNSNNNPGFTFERSRGRGFRETAINPNGGFYNHSDGRGHESHNWRARDSASRDGSGPGGDNNFSSSDNQWVESNDRNDRFGKSRREFSGESDANMKIEVVSGLVGRIIGRSL